MLAYSVPEQSRKVFLEGILSNPLIQKHLPPEVQEVSAKIKFEGSDAPSLPINWRFAESVTSLKAYEATIINVLLGRKYGVPPAQVKINSDHAQLFIMSTLLWRLDPDGDNLSAASVVSEEGRRKIANYFPDWDNLKASSSLYRTAVTNIYRTKDDKFFHLHGSMNPNPTLDSIGLPHDMESDSAEEAEVPIREKIASLSAQELDRLEADDFRQAGTICWTPEEYRQSEHGKANAHVGLFDIHAAPNSVQQPGWWVDSPDSSPARPLAGLKVLELTRVIAGPAIGRGLAELGASVMRITAPHLPDFSSLHADLNHGKWNACLDLRQEQDRQKLRDLLLEADVFVQGYRPGVLEKFGFGKQHVLDICSQRERGIIYAAENCYGWNGPWRDRSGWQQISDANVGVSYEFGRAMGNDEPVTPVFPNSDYCTGIAGVIGIITALLRRADQGGSYVVDIALNYYSQWLVNSCGVYPQNVWQELHRRSGSLVFRHNHNMGYTIPRVLGALHKNGGGDALFNNRFFTQYHAKSLGKDMKIVAPVLQYPNGEVKLGFHIGTRTNGVDQPRWPADLRTEVVH